MALWVLLRPVNAAAALLLLVLTAVGIALQCVSYLPLLAVLTQREITPAPQGLTGAELDEPAAVSVTTFQVGFVTAQFFFAAWLFPLGWLVLRSGFLPRALGWLLLLLLLDGIAVLIWFLQALVAPDHPAISYPMWVIGFVAEVGLALWLLIKGTHPETPSRHLPAPHVAGSYTGAPSPGRPQAGR